MSKKLRLSLLFILMLTILMSAIPVQAATSTKTKAMKAYNTFLSRKTVKVANDTVPSAKVKFAIAYIDNDDVPELIVRGTHTYSIGLQSGKPTDHGFQVYTFKNGKVKKTGLFYAIDKIDPGIDASITKYYKKKNCVIAVENYSGDKYTDIRGKVSLIKFNDSFYTGNRDKKITKKEFAKTLKKIVGSKKATTVKYYKNTKANRKKILK